MTRRTRIARCANFDPDAGPGGGLFEETGADQRINPGFQMEPAAPQLPEYLAPWANNLPAGELHPEIDELAFAPNTVHSSAVRRVPRDPVLDPTPIAASSTRTQFGDESAKLRMGTAVPEQPERHSRTISYPTHERHVPVPQPGGAERRGEGATAA